MKKISLQLSLATPIFLGAFSLFGASGCSDETASSVETLAPANESSSSSPERAVEASNNAAVLPQALAAAAPATAAPAASAEDVEEKSAAELALERASGSNALLADDPGAGWSFQVIQVQTVNGVPVELIRTTRPDGGKSYLLYTHSTLPTNAPVVVVNQPYAAIDWTGEAVDAAWKLRGPGLHPDNYAPFYNNRDKVEYLPQTVQQAVDSQGVWRINGAAVITAYGRFYTGGVLAEDILDGASAYFFARTRKTEINVNRIGNFGASWGGMMALYGARYSPIDARPIVTAAISPVSDFIDWWQWGKTGLPAAQPTLPAELFFSPYFRRAIPNIGNPPVVGPQSRPFTHAGLCPGFPGKALVPHDAWDNIIPLSETQKLATACPGVVEPLYWRRTGTPVPALDHGPMSAEGVFPAVYTFAYSFVSLGIVPAPATVTSVADQASLEIYLRLVLARQRTSGNAGVTDALKQVKLLTESRLSLLDTVAFAPHPGAEVVAKAINTVWKKTFTAATVRTQLATSFPAPPPL